MLIIPKIKYEREYSQFELNIPNMNIAPGKLVLIKGANGSGKTTFGKILSGKIKTSYKPSKTLYLDQITDNNLFSDLKVSEHLKLLKNKEKLKQIKEFFPIIDKLWNKYPDELSGGEKQLVGFCSIVLSNNTTYIFDELFNHLDAENQLKTLEFIKFSLIEKSDNIVFVIAHKYEHLVDYFDLTINISNNQIYLK